MLTRPEAKATLGGDTLTVLDHRMRRKNAWTAHRVDIARHWVATRPYPGHGLNE